MELWLRCKISPGQFVDEYAISGSLFDGKGFSLFAQKRDIEFEDEPTDTTTVEGNIRVIQIKRTQQNVIVRLPAATLENGQTIAVSTGSVSPAHQDA